MDIRRNVSVYISYRQSDASELANWLRERLLQQGGVDVWLDTNALRPGEEVLTAIDGAIAKSDAVLVLLSKAGVESKWVQHDHELARSLGKRCFPILVQRDAPVPEYFRELLWVDLSNPENRTEPFQRLYEEILRVGSRSPEPPRPPDPEPTPVPTALSLAYRAVLAQKVPPDMLRNLEAFPWVSLLQNTNLSDLEQSLPAKAPQPLWEAWIRSTKPREVAALERALGAVIQSKRVPG
jgi:hypothetical protein